MKNIVKFAMCSLAVIALVACEESPVKTDYDGVVDPSAAPKGVVTYEADVYMNKARFNGKVENVSQLLDYGFVYCHDSICKKFNGSIEDALKAGSVSSDNVISLKDKDENGVIETIVSGLRYKASEKNEYYYCTFAVNANGVTYSDPEKFATNGVAKELVKCEGSTDEATWKSFGFYNVNISTEGDGFTFNKFDATRSSNGYSSMAKKGPNTYKRDNALCIGFECGIDMKIDYLVYPTAKTYSSYREKYALVISEDSLTDKNLDKAQILDSLTIELPYDPATEKNKSVSDNDRLIERSVSIPVEYEHKKVWIGIRHYEVYTQGLFVEKMYVY